MTPEHEARVAEAMGKPGATVSIEDMLAWLDKPHSFVAIHANTALHEWDGKPVRAVAEWVEVCDGYTKRSFMGRGPTLREALGNLVLTVAK